MKIVLNEVGISLCPALFRDRLFLLALLACIPVVIILRFFVVGETATTNQSVFTILLFFVLWTPFWEELLFRGIIQGQLLLPAWGRKQIVGLSHANWLSSVLFVIAHGFLHPPLWAIAVIFPSLVFGYFRERHRSMFPAFLLHAVYNLAYLLAFGFW